MLYQMGFLVLVAILVPHIERLFLYGSSKAKAQNVKFCKDCPVLHKN